MADDINERRTEAIRAGYEGSHEDRVERYERMREMRARGMTMAQIGEAETPKLSRQRVSEILKAGIPQAPGRPW